MMTKSKLALVAVAAVLGAASPALAQNFQRPQVEQQYGRAQNNAQYGRSESFRNGRLNQYSPELNGGGSIGSNELNHDDTQ